MSGWVGGGRIVLFWGVINAFDCIEVESLVVNESIVCRAGKTIRLKTKTQKKNVNI